MFKLTVILYDIIKLYRQINIDKNNAFIKEVQIQFYTHCILPNFFFQFRPDKITVRHDIVR